MSLLIDKMYYEYAYHKYFSGDSVCWDKWQDDQNWKYPKQDVMRFHRILEPCLDVIQNKKVLDIGCFLGYLGSMFLKNGCTLCRFIEARQSWLNIAQEIVQLQHYKNADFIQADIQDCQNLQNITQGFDTAVLASVLYHVQNPFEILESLQHIPCIVIESKETSTTLATDKPIIEYKLENLTRTDAQAVDSEKQTVIVGKPNRSWYLMAMTELGYKLDYEDLYYMPDNDNNLRLYKFVKV